MKKTFGLFACLFLAVCMLFAGCGKKPDSKLQAIADQVNSSMESVKESMKDTVDIEVKAEGKSTIVYTSTFKTDVGDVSVMKTSLEQGIEQQKSVFEGILTMLKSQNIESPVVRVDYLDNKGKKIYTTKFK